MSLKNQIKTQLILFTVFLCGFVATFLYLFQQNYHQFNEEIFKRSGENIEIIDSLTKIDTNLYIHKKALIRYLDSGNSKWLVHVTEAEKAVLNQFSELENYNMEHFRLWVPLDNYFVTNAMIELENQLAEFQKGQAQDSGFQRLFYLTRLNINQLFDKSSSVIKKFQLQQIRKSDSGDGVYPDSSSRSGVLDERQFRLVYAAINQMVNSYNQMFWDYSQGQNSQYHRNSNNYFLFLTVSSVLLVMFAVFILVRVFRFFYLHKLTQDNLILMGAKDAVTGLFNRQSFESLGLQEVERAKRRGYHLSLLVLKLEPYDSIRADLGQVTLDRVMFLFAEVIRSTVRVYDGLFRYDDDTFVVQLSETDAKAINSIVERFQSRFKKTKFPIKKKSLAMMPQVRIGFSIYPIDAENLQDLYQFAVRNLSINFDAFKVTHAVLELEESGSNSINSVSSQQPSPPYGDKSRPADLNAMFESTPVVANAPANAEQVLSDNNKWQPANEILTRPEPDSESQSALQMTSSLDQDRISAAQEPEEASTKIAFSDIHALGDEEEVPDVVAALHQDEAPDSADAVNSDVTTDDLNDVSVMKSQQKEDIITVDFDRPSADLATEFRKKQKERRLK